MFVLILLLLLLVYLISSKYFFSESYNSNLELEILSLLFDDFFEVVWVLSFDENVLSKVFKLVILLGLDIIFFESFDKSSGLYIIFFFDFSLFIK